MEEKVCKYCDYWNEWTGACCNDDSEYRADFIFEWDTCDKFSHTSNELGQVKCTKSDNCCERLSNKMKVSELIEKLKAMPQDSEVVMGFMTEIKSIRYHDFGGLTDEKVVQLNQYEENGKLHS